MQPENSTLLLNQKVIVAPKRKEMYQDVSAGYEETVTSFY